MAQPSLWTLVRAILGAVLGLDHHRARCVITPSTRFGRVDDGSLDPGDLREVTRRLAACTGSTGLPVPRLEQTVGDYTVEVEVFLLRDGRNLADLAAQAEDVPEGGDPFTKAAAQAAAQHCA
jgi:hypothetical protein